MTSSQPVTTPNAINFTPDNLHAYSYSGLRDSGASDTEVTFLNFKTQSEYIVGKFQFFYATDSVQGSDMIYRIKFNDQIITQYLDIEDIRMAGDPHQPIRLIIPPFTEVTVTIASIAGAQQQAAIFTGKAIGMTETKYQ